VFEEVLAPGGVGEDAIEVEDDGPPALARGRRL
jgi:hypothetical protein